MHERNGKTYQLLHAHTRDNLNQETGCFLIQLLPSLFELPLLLLHLTVEELQQMIYVPSVDAINILGKRYEQSKVKLSMIKEVKLYGLVEG
jgi:hypothetical protein